MLSNFVIFADLNFFLNKNSRYRKLLDDANFLSVSLYVVHLYVCIRCLHAGPRMADVRNLSSGHMGCERPKINDAVVEY
jgi:hypothetical protein